jgi:hypothetical protein
MFWGGRALLASGRFDLVYFTTATFSFFTFGYFWQRRFGTPYVVDFQDPWVAGRSSRRRGLKARLSALIDPGMERVAVVHAAGLIAVSDAYIYALSRRYSRYAPAWLRDGRHAVIPFCALEYDLVEAGGRASGVAAPQSAELSLHYVGAGATMRKSFSLICRTLSYLRRHDDELAKRVRIRLFGTGSLGKDFGRAILQDIAREAGVGDVVEEQPGRVPYRRALQLVLESDGLLILGVDDSGYVPSKLIGYALSGKPLLACMRKEGPAFAFLQTNPELGLSLWFDRAGEMPLPEAAAVFRRFLEQVVAHVRIDRRATLEPHLAPAMARRHVEVFEACLAAAPTKPDR